MESVSRWKWRFAHSPISVVFDTSVILHSMTHKCLEVIFKEAGKHVAAWQKVKIIIVVDNSVDFSASIIFLKVLLGNLKVEIWEFENESNCLLMRN